MMNKSNINKECIWDPDRDDLLTITQLRERTDFSTNDNAGLRQYHSNSRKWRRTKEPLDEGERGEWESWLKAQHLEN